MDTKTTEDNQEKQGIEAARLLKEARDSIAEIGSEISQLKKDQRDYSVKLDKYNEKLQKSIAVFLREILNSGVGNNISEFVRNLKVVQKNTAFCEKELQKTVFCIAETLIGIVGNFYSLVPGVGAAAITANVVLECVYDIISGGIQAKASDKVDIFFDREVKEVLEQELESIIQKQTQKESINIEEAKKQAGIAVDDVLYRKLLGFLV